MAHLIRNDLMVAHKLIQDARRNIDAADHRMQNTMAGLQKLIDKTRRDDG